MLRKKNHCLLPTSTISSSRHFRFNRCSTRGDWVWWMYTIIGRVCEIGCERRHRRHPVRIHNVSEFDDWEREGMSFVCVYVISCITKCYLFAVIYIIRRIYLSNHIVVIVLRTQQGDIMVNTLYVLVCVRLCCAHENRAWRVQINSII